MTLKLIVLSSHSCNFYLSKIKHEMQYILFHYKKI